MDYELELELKMEAKYKKQDILAVSLSNVSTDIYNNTINIENNKEGGDCISVLPTRVRYLRSESRAISYSCSTLNRTCSRNLTEQQRATLHNGSKTSLCSLTVPETTAPISKNNSCTSLNLYLMGGIVCDPVMPRRKSTGIPLVMHEEEYRMYKSTSSLMSRVSTDYSMHSSNGQIMSAYEAFLQKKGRIFIVKSYQSDIQTFRVMLSQYGNMQMSLMNKEAKSTFFVQICLMSENKCVAKSIKKLDFYRALDNYQFNYVYKFQSESFETVRDHYLHIKLKHKQHWYSRIRTVLAREVKLLDVQLDTEDYIETPLF